MESLHFNIKNIRLIQKKSYRIQHFFLVFAFLSTLFIPNTGLAIWSFEAASGVVYNLPVPLTIDQNGYPPINMTARYETKPFSPPPYYVLRIGQWTGNSAWEVEMLHHKVYLENTTEDIQRFTITNGYNLFHVNYAQLTDQRYIVRGGLGVVLTHPESTIRNQPFSETGGTLNNWGYYLTGPSGMLSLGKRFYLSKAFFIELEGKMTASYAVVPINGGQAQAPDVALHANIGLGYDVDIPKL